MADGSPPPSMPGPMPSSFGSDEEYIKERPVTKFFRKIKEEPLIPLGMGLTVFAFINAYRAIRRGDSRQANIMFRARIAAQGFTVFAMVAGGFYYDQDRKKSQELRKLQEERDAEEKRQKWIRELEARDREDKLMKETIRERKKPKTDYAAVMESSKKAEGREPAMNAGSVLAKMGRWPQSQEMAEKEAVSKEPSLAVTAAQPEEEKKESPKSS
ncbi:hypothetical protein E4U57_003804 [Claviceps arundinis]|uniref:HIG1 domain-containing protein n=1 Tax=Claviceps arundinis TaxID=1623583 RepID=A0A9P7SSP6_9HYPO|nr:hypothetical protein E4U57_003804 [Claviceps arundinis]KAG5971968.1 hypothetical protein E4U56_006479 [Claviceps arundinis]